MGKVLLITLESPFLDNDFVFPYLGALTLVSVAKRKGCTVHLMTEETSLTDFLCCSFIYCDNITLLNEAYIELCDTVMLSVTTPQADSSRKFAQELKHNYPGIKIVIGGGHATHYTQECLELDCYDHVVVGEGELFLEEFLDGNINNRLWVSTDENECPIELPYREKDHLQRYSYLLNGCKATTLVSSRGCPNRCAFCESCNTKVRQEDLNKFSRDVQSVVSAGFNSVMIFDDIFALSSLKLQGYASILRRYYKEFNFQYRCFTHAKIVKNNPQIIDILSVSGCVEIGFGAESGSQRILNRVNKNTTLEDMGFLIDYAISRNIKVKGFFMLGLPSEEEDDAERTLQFIAKYRLKYPGMFDFDITIFFPYKGTPIGNDIRSDPSSWGIRLRDGLNWYDIDRGSYGAYKKKQGKSDLIIETYDWSQNKVLLSAERILELQEKISAYSGRYAKPVIEGNIQ
jgi:anaerobic magnesium-protoporphyrin IX monomethyl ester cyclase